SHRIPTPLMLSPSVFFIMLIPLLCSYLSLTRWRCLLADISVPRLHWVSRQPNANATSFFVHTTHDTRHTTLPRL
ncbi:hypothetical protein K438DRAFT_1872113, partial [Mycena galopus ATCC 62051]